ncbi:hypothetical protein, partial [Escherichia coli]|uniref:hypothetical protein n=1 Tax=Escherichia coli TaxID=562 RepID=UPI001F4B38C5
YPSTSARRSAGTVRALPSFASPPAPRLLLPSPRSTPTLTEARQAAPIGADFGPFLAGMSNFLAELSNDARILQEYDKHSHLK